MMKLDFTGLMTGPDQRWGSIRIVPLLRDRPIDGLRLDPRVDGAGNVDHAAGSYVSYIPHSFVASWGDEPGAAYGTQLSAGADRTPISNVPILASGRLTRRAVPPRLRFLPLRLAVEGYLSLHFGGPSIVWRTGSLQAIRHGLSPHVEESYSGAWVTGLDDALRHFEILDGQCGLLLYVADYLAGAFVTPHPDDYRALHSTLIHDMYGERVWRYSAIPYAAPPFSIDVAEHEINSLDDLSARIQVIDREQRECRDLMALDLLRDNEYMATEAYELGEFQLWRFAPSFTSNSPRHIGEYITDHHGSIAYLKTFSMSTAQAKRGWYLQQLADAGWDLERAADATGVTMAQYTSRLDAIGYGFLVRENLMNRFRR